jgi:uncharacterized alpha/beta hydrolase family protein
MVYLVHGYGSFPIAMSSIENDLKKEKFHTCNFGYNSISKDIDSCSKLLYLKIKSNPVDTVCFVTHSMGGLVVRGLLNYARADSAFPKIARIVMLAPPNHGAQIADFFSSTSVLKWVLGPNVEHMRTDSNSFASKLPVPQNSELGIILGARFDGTGYNPFIKGDNDGFLTAEKARLGTEKETITVPEAHIFMPQNRTIRKYIVHFLLYGNFTKE